MEFNLDRTLEVLERTPKALRGLYEGMSEEWLEGDEGPETWSPKDLLGHYLQGEEEDWVPRLQIILEHGESRPFKPFDRTAFKDLYSDLGASDLLERFSAKREENLRAVRELDISPEQLASLGTHPEFGPVTAAQLLATWAVHDLSHLAQISRVMCKQYRECVGPWRGYLPILNR